MRSSLRAMIPAFPMVQDLTPYIVGLALPFLLWMLFVAFRWRYLRHVRRTIYSPVTPTSADPDAERPRRDVHPLPIVWIDAAREAQRPAPHRLLDALAETRAMRAALAAAGAVYVASAAAVVWHGQKMAGMADRPAVALAYFSTIVGLMLIVAFTARGWKNWIAASLGWLAGALLLLVWLLHIRPAVAISITANGLQYASMPFVCMAPLAMRTTRPLLTGFMPMVALWFASTAAMGFALQVFGLSLEGHYTFPTVAAGLLSAAAGIAVAVWRLRSGLRLSFVLLLCAMLAAAVAWAAYFPFSVIVAMAGGIGLNGLLTLAVWAFFSRFLRLKARGYLPDEILHYSFCWLVLTALLPILANMGWGDAPLALLTYAAYVAAITLLLWRRQRRMETGPPGRLLLLRVFGEEPVRNRLLDVLDVTWRRVGRVDLIVGADLAVRSLSAIALEEFLLGRVHRHFLTNRRDADRSVATLAEHRALDGRYPLNEFHCSPDVWQHVVAVLASKADVVLMDLRGLRPTNRGAIVELSLVMERVPLPRIVLLADKQTDDRLLLDALQHAWSQLPEGSSNASIAEPSLEVLRCSGRRSSDAGAIAKRVFVAASAR